MTMSPQRQLALLLSCIVLGSSLRLLIAAIKSGAPDYSHLEGMTDEHSQLVSMAKRGFMSAKMGVLSQIMALECAVIAVVVGSYLETKRIPKAKIHLSERAQIAQYIGYGAAILALVMYLQNFEMMCEVVFSGSGYKVTIWALKFSAAFFSGLQLGEYCGSTVRKGEIDLCHLLDLLAYCQKSISQLPEDSLGEDAKVSAEC